MIFLTLPYPVSANRYWRAVSMPGRLAMVPTKEAKAYRTQVLKRYADAGGGLLITGRISIAIHLYPQRPQDWQRRMRLDPEGWSDTVRCLDLDNANKVLLDALKNVAFEDDRLVRMLQSQRMEPDEHGARVEIWICQMPSEQRQQSLTDQPAMETA